MAGAAWADTLRVAVWNAELSRKGPGILLRDIRKGEDAQVDLVIESLATVKPDILLLLNFDYDLENRALTAFADAARSRGVDFPHQYAARSNSGLATGLDLNGDGRFGGPEDAQGYGEFFGAGAMALLSRHPVDEGRIQDFSGMLWRDLPGTLFPMTRDGPFAGQQVHEVQRLSSKGHWVVPIDVPDIGIVTLLAFHATPPVFDGPEDRNGRRNHDEAAFWLHYLDGAFGEPATNRFVLMGDANLDPEQSEGRKEAIRALLAHPLLQNPFPNTPTANWPKPGPGERRVDYILPSADWHVSGFGTTAPSEASRHILLWADLELHAP